ncbi:hypothetical protein Q765_18760 [Flavobacterium rivuli WB 3.3-2 = DSM 21788]|uniref:Uncharacterized protein n=1 Tax=Flavobacterium rivuli WB 3.3-2 = DSM 21788 TaxID=1121895 RepID=A0A0A2M9H6_9FLAO|nr:hypothetical protein [Flavobacterium rivuli]KGO84950.1 hypothetical protein Q765_18760 [Flavobacterium rivuli WB 3.3-2 = DSM 21788]
MNRILFAVLLASGVCFGQKIAVADLQLKLEPADTQELLYGFAEGDRVIFTIEEANGNYVSEVSVMQYPETYKYRRQNIKKEKAQEFTVNNKSVFAFRFKNDTKGKRVCNVKIMRVPKNSADKNFNTAIKWVTKQDTVWNSLTKDVVVGYDTLHVQKTRRVVLSEKKYEEIVLDKSQRVNAKTSMGETKTGIDFTLPLNYVAKDETKKVVAWAYWVGVGKESNEFWKENRKMIVEGVKGVATYFSTPLGGIAAGTLTNLVLPVNGEDVEYALVNEANNKLFLANKPCKPFDSGKGVAAYKRFTDTGMQQGKYFMALANDNYIQPIDVNVKVSAIIEHLKYKDEKYTDTTITPRYEKKIVSEPQIVTNKIPVTFDYK